MMSSIQHNVDLRPFNIWGVGGQAARLAVPANTEELVQCLRQHSRTHPVYLLGLGSNVLALDTGFAGTVVVTHRYLREISLLGDGLVYAQCGVAQARLARFLAAHALAGGEFHAGIPGTVGGALAMNAGAFGAQTWDRVVEVDTVDRRGRIRSRPAREFEVSYRRVLGLEDGEIFLGARLQFAPGTTEEITATVRRLLRQRNASQPVGARTCGSVFVNPLPLSAGRLIDECGLKGFRVGAAEVSRKHANFIVNTGHARSHDIVGLVRHIQDEVLRQRDQRLIPEFRFLATPADIPAHFQTT